MLPLAALGAPIKLKLAYFTSDQTRAYTLAIKPFIDAVNADEDGGLLIEAYPGGALGKDPAQQAQMLRDGAADIAYVVLGAAANEFRDHAVMELPGLFRDMPEATWVNTRLVASGILRGYEDFFVIASFATEPEGIHTRVPIASLADLRGKRIRANNPIEASALAMLGMSPVVLPIVKTPEAISRGTIDGAATALGPLLDFGLGRVVTYHYFLRLGPSVRSILMSRAKFESLPKAGQDVIRKYSGNMVDRARRRCIRAPYHGSCWSSSNPTRSAPWCSPRRPRSSWPKRLSERCEANGPMQIRTIASSSTPSRRRSRGTGPSTEVGSAGPIARL